MKTTVIYHGDADGFGAAYAVSKRKDIEVIEYIPVQYDRPFPILHPNTEALFILDFSYNPLICESAIKLYDLKTLVILDHHESAKDMLAGNKYAHFDMTKSGAVMTWEYFHPDTQIPDILRYVQDRDLWKFILPYSEEVNLYIASFPQTFEAWDTFNLIDALLEGAAIKTFRDNQIDRSLKNITYAIFNGYRIPIVNCTANISEVGNEICKKFPEAQFSVVYYDRGDGMRSYSLRSIGDFNVAEVAKCYGGGGHKNAAGFTLKKDLVEAFFE